MVCVICKLKDNQVEIFKENLLIVLKCQSCGSIYSNFKPETKHLGSEDMVNAIKINKSKMNLLEFIRFFVARIVFKSTAKFDYEYIKKHTNKQKFKSALDIGAQYGFLINNLLKNGIDAHGIDAIEHPHSVSDKIDYIFFSENYDNKNLKYDLIILGDILQLTKNPVKVLEKIFSMLEKDGCLLITTVNPNCNNRQDFIKRTKDWYLTFIGKQGFELICKENDCSLIKLDYFDPQLYTVKSDLADKLKVIMSLVKYFFKINKGFKKNEKGIRQYILIKKL